MKKRYLVVPAALLLLAGMYMGNNDQPKLSSAEKNEVIIRAKNFIRRINRREYESCYSLFDGKLKESMTLNRWLRPLTESLIQSAVSKNSKESP